MTTVPAPTIAITGGFGFLGWHLACRLKALRGVVAIRIGRDEFDDAARLGPIVAANDVIIHIAGINRAEDPASVEGANIALAEQLADAITTAGRPTRLVYANSIQAELDNPYGRGKAKAAQILRAAVAEVGGSMIDVLLPNLFGEHGRPNYNSFVATFCAKIVAGEAPTIIEDRTVPLLHAQRAAQELIDAIDADPATVQVTPAGHEIAVSEVLTLLKRYDDLYRSGEIPEIGTEFELDLFNTYRSFTFPQRAEIRPEVHSDARGDLFETLRAHGGRSQSYASSTVVGATRGEHYHLHKVERFIVLKGEAEIGFRRLFHDEIVTVRVSGTTPTIVDMPTMWVHNLRNVGDEDLLTFFWSDQLLDRDNPDQYYELVDPAGATA